MPESTLTSLKEEEIDEVDSPPNLPLDSLDEQQNGNSRGDTPTSEIDSPSKGSQTPTSPVTVPKSRECAITLEDNTGTSSLTSQSRLVSWANDCNVVFFEKNYFNLRYPAASVILKPCF